jgi:phosphoribosylaminoimidazole-succinocarboxamide synthase
MATLSPMRAAVPLLEGLLSINRGKVRDTYELGNGLLLIVVTNAISIFDFVLNAMVDQKGYVLNMFSHFWFTKLMQKGYVTHFVAAGAAIDQYLPLHLRGNPDLQMRAMVVRKLNMAPVEFVYRNFFSRASKSFAEYPSVRTICGHELPLGLQDGDRLPITLDTPTTKAASGPDEPLDADKTRAQYSVPTGIGLSAFKWVSEYLEKRGLILADTKMEMDRDGMIGDEVFTPDSSRFWDLAAWKKTRKEIVRKAPPPLDKQLVRAFGIEHGINKLNANDPEDIARAHTLEIPALLLRATTQTLRYILWRSTGKTLEQYAATELGITLPVKKKRVAILLGSDSDLPTVRSTIKAALRRNVFEALDVHVISCHRNPAEIEAFAACNCNAADVVIAAGSKAFALPGVLDALLRSKKIEIPVIGVALGKVGSKSRLAAELSISELPGEPVIMNEMVGRPYSGAGGLESALNRVATGELPPPKILAKKPVVLNIHLI